MDRLAVVGLVSAPARRRVAGPKIWRDYRRVAPEIPAIANGPVRSAAIVGNLAGLGEDCPSIAPYRLPTGSCTNVDPANWASLNRPEINEASGGTAPLPSGGCPSGFAKNSWGQCEPMTLLQVENMQNRFGAQLTTDRQTQERLAAEAKQLGAKYGLSVSCSIHQNSSPIPGDPVMYGTDCTVNGDPGHSAALMLLPGGMQTTLVEVSRAAGNPIYAPPPPVPGAVAPAGATATAQALKQQTTATTTATTTPVKTTTEEKKTATTTEEKKTTATDDTTKRGSSGGAGDGDGSSSFDLSFLTGSIDIAGYSIPFWALGLAGGLFFMQRGQR